MRVKTTGTLMIAALLLVLPATAAAHGKWHGEGKVVRVHSGESIQAAINAAKPGTTIKIDEGTFKESLVINKDDIDLVGAGRKATNIVPPDNPTPGQGCVEPAEPGQPASVNGICAFDIDDQGNVLSHIDDLDISNLSVNGFNGIGIFLVGNRDASVKRVIASDNAAYGIFANNSSDTIIARNVTGNDGEAGIYVGDSPDADAVVWKNVAYGSFFGVFIRDAAHGQVLQNKAFSNCAGIVFLNTDETAGAPPGPPPTSVDVEDWSAEGNDATANNKVCTDEEGTFAGIGFAIVSANDIRLSDNGAFGNEAPANSGTPFAGGFVVVGDPTFKPSSNTKIKFNTALANVPDILWDGQGNGNEFVGNDCLTSDPDGLCTDPIDDEWGGHGDDGGSDHGHHGDKKKKHGKGHGSRHEQRKHHRD